MVKNGAFFTPVFIIVENSRTPLKNNRNQNSFLNICDSQVRNDLRLFVILLNLSLSLEGLRFLRGVKLEKSWCKNDPTNPGQRPDLPLHDFRHLKKTFFTENWEKNLTMILLNWTLSITAVKPDLGQTVK